MYRVYNPYFIAFISTIGAMLFGFDISSVSAFLNDKNYRSFFNYPNSAAQGGITASMAGGSFLGSLVAGFISDRIGRKPTIQISAWIWIIGSAIQCSVRNRGQLIVGRLIAGLSIGLASTQVPVFIAEISPKEIRGRLVGLFQWSITWGIMIMFYISFGCSKIKHPTAGFRTAWGIQMIPGLILYLGMLFLPESPRWLAGQDRWEEAIEIIAQVTAKGNVNDPEVLIEIEEIKEVVRVDREAASLTIFDLFKKDSIHRTMIGILGQMWQQLTGMNVIMYYTTTVFSMAGYSGNSNLVASSIQYVINVLMTVPALLFIDKWGRRPLLMIGCFFMITWQFAVAGLLATYGNHVSEVDGNTNIRLLIHNKSAAKATIACSYLFVASFAPTWGPGMWIYCSEIFPLRQRAVANGLCGAANWIFNFAIGMYTPVSFTNITWKTYIIYGVFCVAMVIHVFLLFPETKGKTLEEIDQIWAAKIPAWKTASFVPYRPDISDIKAFGGGRAPSLEKTVEQETKENVAATANEPTPAAAPVDAYNNA